MSSSVRLGQNTQEKPSWRNDDSDANVRLGVEAEELGASLVNLAHLGGWIIDQVFSRELIEAVIKLELWEHEQTLSDSVLFHLLSLTELPTSYVGRHHGGSWHVSPLLLSKQRQVVCDEAVQWERVDGNFGLRKHVEHIELIGHGALLTNGKHLEPT